MRSVMKWGIVALVLIVPFAISAQAGDHAYVGAQKCKMCHRVEFTSWENTVHAKATENAKAAKDRKFGPECLKCHATNSDESMSGVQCEACHGPGADYKKMSIMKDVEKAKANGLILPRQETCNGCHDGKDHHKKVDWKASIKNKKAIHEFKKDPTQFE